MRPRPRRLALLALASRFQTLEDSGKLRLKLATVTPRDHNNTAPRVVRHVGEQEEAQHLFPEIQAVLQRFFSCIDTSFNESSRACG